MLGEKRHLKIAIDEVPSRHTGYIW